MLLSLLVYYVLSGAISYINVMLLSLLVYYDLSGAISYMNVMLLSLQVYYILSGSTHYTHVTLLSILVYYVLSGATSYINVEWLNSMGPSLTNTIQWSVSNTTRSQCPRVFSGLCRPPVKPSSPTWWDEYMFTLLTFGVSGRVNTILHCLIILIIIICTCFWTMIQKYVLELLLLFTSTLSVGFRWDRARRHQVSLFDILYLQRHVFIKLQYDILAASLYCF